MQRSCLGVGFGVGAGEHSLCRQGTGQPCPYLLVGLCHLLPFVADWGAMNVLQLHGKGVESHILSVFARNVVLLWVEHQGEAIVEDELLVSVVEVENFDGFSSWKRFHKYFLFILFHIHESTQLVAIVDENRVVLTIFIFSSFIVQRLPIVFLISQG